MKNMENQDNIPPSKIILTLPEMAFDELKLNKTSDRELKINKCLY